MDFSKPANDGVFDGAAFEKFLHDRIKVDGKAGALGDNIKIHREGTIPLVVQFIFPIGLYPQATTKSLSPLPLRFRKGILNT